MHNYHMTLVSGNQKTGAIPVSTTSKNSCPASCPLKGNGCYAEYSNLGLHWERVSKGTSPNTLTLEQFVGAVKALPYGQLWRHNQAGDLPQGLYVDRIHWERTLAIAHASYRKRGYTYTHYPWDEDNYKNGTQRSVAKDNLELIRAINKDKGFTINVSCNNLAEADKAWHMGLPTVVVVPEDYPKRSKTEGGAPVIVCPAQTQDNITCARCALCYRKTSTRQGGEQVNRHIVAFRVHGNGRKKVKLALELPVKQ